MSVTGARQWKRCGTPYTQPRRGTLSETVPQHRRWISSRRWGASCRALGHWTLETQGFPAFPAAFCLQHQSYRYPPGSGKPAPLLEAAVIFQYLFQYLSATGLRATASCSRLWPSIEFFPSACCWVPVYLLSANLLNKARLTSDMPAASRRPQEAHRHAGSMLTSS